MTQSPVHDPRTLALVQADLDGELDAAGRAELARRLAEDPEARKLRDDMERLGAALERLPSLPAPLGLRQAVLAATAPRARPPRLRRTWPRYAAALAAGVVLGVFGAMAWQPPRPAFDAADLVGAMGRQDGRLSPEPEGSWQVATPEVQGRVDFAPVDGRWLLVFDLDSRLPVTVTTTYVATALRLQGHAQGDSGAGEFTAAPGRFGFINDGSQRLSLFLAPGRNGEGPARVTVRIEAGGRVLQEGVLVATDASSGH